MQLQRKAPEPRRRALVLLIYTFNFIQTEPFLKQGLIFR
jgi:hypothetical protein